MKNKITLLTLTLTLLVSFANAQEWEFGLFVGPAQYQGDLSKSQVTWKYTRIQGGVLARYNLTPHISFKFAGNYGTVKGDDKAWGSKLPTTFKMTDYGKNNGISKEANYYDRNKRNLNFRSSIIEATAQVEYNILNFIPGSKSHRWTPYLLAGISVFRFNPKTDLNGTTYKLRGYQTELNKPKYSLISFAIPTGFGIKYNFGNLWSIGFEIAGRKTFTDYLDDVHDNYPMIDPANPTANQLADRSGEAINPATKTNYPQFGIMQKPYSHDEKKLQRGDYRDKDTYIFTGFTITKTIRKFVCANF
ncbi:MAG: DUF6089 family protein [Bacteroidota bacterium]|nr:DUF6089 family protein [Bacteroidota bacterium]